MSLSDSGTVLSHHVLSDVKESSLPPEVLAEFLSNAVLSHALQRRPAQLIVQTASLARYTFPFSLIFVLRVVYFSLISRSAARLAA
jgi:hypothetical protein